MLAVLAALVALAGAGWMWMANLRAREAATGACRRFCEAHEVQFLDDTVALQRLQLVRHGHRFGIRRVYGFEFSREGTDRGAGAVTVSGPHVESVYLPLLDHPQ